MAAAVAVPGGRGGPRCWTRGRPERPAPTAPAPVTTGEPPVLRVVEGLTGDVLCEVPADYRWELRHVLEAVEEATEIPGHETRLLWAGAPLREEFLADMLAGDERTLRLVRIDPEWSDSLDKIGERILTDGSLEAIADAVASGGDAGETAVKAAQAYARNGPPEEEEQCEIFLRDRRFVMAALLQEGSALRFAPEELRADREVALLAVRENGIALQFTAPELRADRDLVLAAVRSNGSALQFSAEALHGDRDVVMAAVQENGEALRFAKEVVRRDREVALTAVRQGGSALRHAHFILQHDRTFILEAVTANGEALTYISNADLRTDKQIVLAAKAFWDGSGVEKPSQMSCLKRAHLFLN